MSLAGVVSFSGLILLLLCFYKTANLLRYIYQARKTGLPYVLTWTLETETVGYILTPILRWKYQDYLLKGEGWPHWCRLMIKDWSFEDKRRAHDEYGEVFLAVSPEGIICYACDAAMGHDVMVRRNEFTKPRDKYSKSSKSGLILSWRLTLSLELLEIYGPNVVTTEGQTFRFHIRVVAPPFADSTGANELVWSETKFQTSNLVSAWQENASESIQRDIDGLSLSIIAKAAFGQRLQWSANTTDAKPELPAGHTLSFTEAMNETTQHMIPVLLLPRWLMRITHLRKAAIAHSEFEKYVRDMIRTEKRNIEASKAYQSTSARGNLLTSVLKASDLEEAADPKSGNGRKQAFSEDEVMGNLFLYLLAGYETTSNAMVYGLISLALYPDVQDQVISEVDTVYAEAASEGRTELTYNDDFDKLGYSWGFMYEALRLFPAPQQITKMVSVPTPVYISQPSGLPKTVVLPAECRVYLNVPATHHTPRYWRDPYKLDPTRWLKAKSETDSQSPNRKTATADRTRQMKGTFLTFSDGGRVCLGRKFAQSEYIAFLAVLLRDHRVELGEDMDRSMVAKEIYLRCKGTLTLAPLGNIKLVLKKREKMSRKA